GGRGSGGEVPQGEAAAVGAEIRDPTPKTPIWLHNFHFAEAAACDVGRPWASLCSETATTPFSHVMRTGMRSWPCSSKKMRDQGRADGKLVGQSEQMRDQELVPQQAGP
ncbi:unnamed protein product, partial [Urochloa humidicola]